MNPTDNVTAPGTAVIEDQATLQRLLTASATGLYAVKPRVFFSKIEGAFSGPVPFELYMPSSGIGSITLLEAAILTSLLKISQPRRAFEFGTFLGYSTSLILKNAPDSCEVFSIDLGEAGTELTEARHYTDAELHADDKKNDDFLRYTQGSRGTYYLKHLPSGQQARLRLLKGDSTHLDVTAQGLSGNVDFVFIDGGHDIDTIASDTRKALEMVGNSGVIAWHDYNSTIHGDVTAFMQGFTADHAVLHVQSTLLALMFVGDARTRFLSFGAG